MSEGGEYPLNEGDQTFVQCGVAASSPHSSHKTTSIHNVFCECISELLLQTNYMNVNHLFSI